MHVAHWCMEDSVALAAWARCRVAPGWLWCQIDSACGSLWLTDWGASDPECRRRGTGENFLLFCEGLEPLQLHTPCLYTSDVECRRQAPGDICCCSVKKWDCRDQAHAIAGTTQGRRMAGAVAKLAALTASATVHAVLLGSACAVQSAYCARGVQGRCSQQAAALAHRAVFRGDCEFLECDAGLLPAPGSSHPQVLPGPEATGCCHRI